MKAKNLTARGVVSVQPGWPHIARSLGLSAAEYGKLAGVSGQSIYKWEQGGTRPRTAQIESLAKVRALGKREARARLEE